MAKKNVELFIHINSSKELHQALNKNMNILICAEIYCSHFGPCVALDKFFTTLKFDTAKGNMILLRVQCDEIQELERFWNHSEPQFMFIVNKRVTQVFRGISTMKLEQMTVKEMSFLANHDFTSRRTYALDETTQDELDWYAVREEEKKKMAEERAKRQAEMQAERKRHRAELMTPYLQHLNFVLFWPHGRHAHPELYEKWNENDIIMVGREEIQMTTEMAQDVLYAGDAVVNEASMQALFAAPALAICFRLLDTEKHFVSLVRRILYEDKEFPEGHSVAQSAYDRYKTYSLTREIIWQNRREDKRKKKVEAKERRQRRNSELRRMAIQSAEEDLQMRKAERENKKLELLKSGNLQALRELEAETVEIIMPDLPEDKDEDDEKSGSEEEDQSEYFPPAGLEIPAFYSPPNDVAKANGLAILFPTLVSEHTTPAAEILPPHVLVMLDVSKRHLAIRCLEKRYKSVLHMGIFIAKTPHDAKHLAYSVKQYDAMKLYPVHPDTKIAFMMSVENDLGLLELIDIHPEYLSRNEDFGEKECSAMFPVHYGDDYDEFEDFPKEEIEDAVEGNEELVVVNEKHTPDEQFEDIQEAIDEEPNLVDDMQVVPTDIVGEGEK